LEDMVRLGVVFCYVEEHCGDGVWEALRVLAGGTQVFFESRFCVGERVWCGVVGGGEPAVAPAGRPAKAGLGAPTADPDRRPGLL
jgi:hypothetical protein